MSMMPIWNLQRLSQEIQSPLSQLPTPKTPISHYTKTDKTAIDNDKENPWLDKSRAPKSTIQPNICFTLRHFEDSSRRMRQSEEEWPYRLDPHNDSHVHFYDFRGTGDPPTDVGYVGDVYITDDLDVWVCQGTPLGSQERKWTCEWRGDMDLRPLIEHPLLRDRYLWFRSGTGSVGPYWYGRKGLINVTVSSTESHDYTPIIRAMFEAEGGSNAANKYSQKRKMGIDVNDSDDDDEDEDDDERRFRHKSTITISKASISQKRRRRENNSNDSEERGGTESIMPNHYAHTTFEPSLSSARDKFFLKQQELWKHFIDMENQFQTEKRKHAETRRAFEDFKKTREHAEHNLKGKIDELKTKNQQLRTEGELTGKLNSDLRRQVARLTSYNSRMNTHLDALVDIRTTSMASANDVSSSGPNDPDSLY